MGNCPLAGKRCQAIRWSKKHAKHHDPTREDAQGVFSAYQAFMGNIQTVSTLLLGFLITGTLLSVMLTGVENYGADKVYLFTTQAVLSVAFSGASMLLGFVIQARGTSAYENFGAVRAVKSMRRSQIFICVAESCIYWSLIFFMWSLHDYVMMNYVGPDICPYTQRELPSTESSCSQLGVDFYFAMRLRCDDGSGDPSDQVAFEKRHTERMIGHLSGGNASDAETAQLKESALHAKSRRKRVDNDFVCEQFKLLGEAHLGKKYSGVLEPMNFAVWDCNVYTNDSEKISVNSDCESPAHLQLINDVSEVYCSVRKMTELRMEFCGSNFMENGVKCAEAYSAFRKAQECVDNTLEDAKRCYQVCQWKGEESPRMRLQKSIGGIIGGATGVIKFIFCLRLVRGLHQTVIICATDNAPVVKQILHQTFVNDPQSSDDDEDAEMEVKDVSRSQADTTDGPTPPQSRGWYSVGMQQVESTPDQSSLTLGRGWRGYTSALSSQTTQLASMSCPMTTPPTSNRQLGMLDSQPRGWNRDTGSGASMMQDRLDSWRAAQSRDPNREVGSSRFSIW